MMSPLFVPRRTNVILYCRLWQETTHFYQNQLRLPVAFANDWFVEFRLTESGFLSIANAARATIAAVQGQGVTVTLEVAELAAVQERLALQGIVTTAIQQKWGMRVFYCHDPEGHRLEFWTTELGAA